MAFQMDEVWVNDGQFMVTKPDNEPKWMEVKGDDKVLHSSYLEGPVHIGKADVYSEPLASCNIGREDKVGTEVRFTKTALTQLIEVPLIATEIGTAYFKSITGAKRKN